MGALGDRPRDFVNPEDEQDGNDEVDEDSELGHLRGDDLPRWVVGILYQMVQQHMERFWQKQMRFDKLTQLGWGNMANYFWERNKTYGTAYLKVPADTNPQGDNIAAAPTLSTLGVQMESWYCAQKIRQSTRNFWTRKLSDEAMVREVTVK